MKIKCKPFQRGEEQRSLSTNSARSREEQAGPCRQVTAGRGPTKSSSCSAARAQRRAFLEHRATSESGTIAIGSAHYHRAGEKETRDQSAARKCMAATVR